MDGKNLVFKCCQYLPSSDCSQHGGPSIADHVCGHLFEPPLHVQLPSW